jgi:histone deacetylase 1/2
MPAKEVAKSAEKPDELIPNPEYDEWVGKDQSVFNYLYGSVSKDVQVRVSSCTTSAAIWKAIQEMNAAQSRGRVINTRMALAAAQKGSSTIAEFFSKVKALADDMAAAGKKLEDEEVASYILAGLDGMFDPVVSTLAGRTEPLTLTEVYNQLTSWEQRMDLVHGGGSESSANSAARGGGRGGFKRGGGGRGRGRNNNSNGGGNNGSGRRNTDGDSATCQLCGIEGHTVLRCRRCFDVSFTGQTKKRSASTATNFCYGVDTNWYTDTGATDHITGELDKLTVRDKYHGNDQVHTASGEGMRISHVGKSLVHTPRRDLLLNNVLYIPEANKNLVSVHRLTSDNHAFIEYHPDHFLIKDQATRRVLHRGDCEGGLYPLKSSPSPNKTTCGVVKASSSRWHARLGHPSSVVVHQILSKNQLPFVSKLNKDTVCDSCQQGKSHRLPYPRSMSTSSKPLEIIFSDVWGPAPTSVGTNSYYLSFIDDFSKFTWVYLLRNKYDVFQKFHDFQKMVERELDHKIITMQTDWGGEYQKLNAFFQRIGISHHVSCPYAHQQNGSAERKHRHIVEVGLSLLAHASMPLKFWDEAFITDTYLINRLPSKVIDNQTPLERLFQQKPDYHTLRTFGCACWPNLRPYNSRKLQFRSKQCVFLGYRNMHKGFKCLDVREGRVYISRDVVFDENVYLFSSLHPNAGARLRSEILLLPPALLNPSHGDDISSFQHDNDSLHTNGLDEHAGSETETDPEQNDARTAANGHDFMQVAPLPFSATTTAHS